MAESSDCGPTVIVRDGDHIVFFFSREAPDVETIDHFNSSMEKAFPNCKTGVAFGVSGVVVYRSDDDSGRNGHANDSS